MVIESEFITICHIFVRIIAFRLCITSFRPRGLLVLWLISASPHITLRLRAVSASSASATRT
jgi:hypothetical protein